MFDTTTRNKLASFVGKARKLLCGDYNKPGGEITSLLQTFSIQPDGAIADLEEVPGLDQTGYELGHTLRDILAHKHAQSHDKKTWGKYDAAVYDLLQEQSFTVLNRLCALRMAEERDLILPCVSQGINSDGFLLYEQITDKTHIDRDTRYQHFLFSMFDELAIDLGTLFDRSSPHSLLFPRPEALGALLDLLNDRELTPLWEADETIGWIYQYWNSKEERKAMRDASAAPRNSRELAVRNQFFTPRYVVEFLTDNTLGRIWYEMTEGRTRLAEQCRYLVRRPTEILLKPVDEFLFDGCRDWVREVRSGNFAAAAEDATWDEISSVALAIDGYMAAEKMGIADVNNHVRPRWDLAESEGLVDDAPLVDQWLLLFCVQRGILREQYQEENEKLQAAVRAVWNAWVRAAKGENNESREALSQEQLLRQPVLIPHRPIKDPREIRLLDPACGSMHFGLYAFDLFETIYEEAWDNGYIAALHDAYASKDEFMRDVPRLIIEHNIHGIDIDPRAVQIAGLSLWLRAQKAWQVQGVQAAGRPRVRRSNIVCAEPMPGSPEMLQDFMKTLDPPLLGELVKTVFDKMQLAGEAGSLLKIEEEIRSAIEQAKKAWEKLGASTRDLFSVAEINRTLRPGTQQELSGIEKSLASDLRPLTSDFWSTAEQQVIDALRAYAEQADSDSYQRRLFADDAAQGFAFIDLCRKRYDAVVMNPPFGVGPKSINALLKKGYTDVPNDLFCQFVSRGGELTGLNSGKTGCITNSSFVIYNEFQEYRQFLLKRGATNWMLDLGEGVLDAYVGAAAYIFDPHMPVSDNLWIADLRKCETKAEESLIMVQAINANEIPRMSSVRRLSAYQLIPGCSFCHWAPDSLWKVVTKNPLLENNIKEAGVGAAPVAEFFRLRWEIPPVELGLSKRWTPLANAGYFAAFYRDDYLTIDWKDNGRRAKAELTVRYPYLNGNVGLRVQRQEWYGRPGLVFGRRTDRFTTQPLCEDSMFSFNGIAVFPSSEIDRDVMLALLNTRFVAYYINLICGLHKNDVYVRRLPCPPLNREQANIVGDNARSLNALQKKAHGTAEASTFFMQPSLTSIRSQNLRSGFQEWRVLDRALEIQFISKRSENDRIFEMSLGVDEDLLEEIQRDQGPDCSMLPLVDVLPKAQITTALQSKLARFRDEVSRDDGTATSDIIRVALSVGCSPISAVTSLNSHALIDESDLTLHGMALCSWLVGTTYGRWDIRYATGERQPPELPDPFAPLPVCPPGMLQNAEGLPAEPKDMPADYPLRISWPGILVDDAGHPEDIVARVRDALKVIWPENWESIEQEACEILGVKELRAYFAEGKSGSKFFADHLSRYSKSRRQAPIYWPLSTASGSYTLWIYYHRLSNDTLYAAVSQFVEPRIEEARQTLARLHEKGDARTKPEDKAYEQTQQLIGELATFREELLRIAGFWKPNLNDGVQITAAPLWSLFHLKKWQDKLKETWQELEKGKYDWAHLAYSIWPDRVAKACEKDRSIAIAHGLDHLCKVQPPKAKKKAKGKAAEEENEEEPEMMEED